ncbi:MAG TPA: hypothetical protein VH476_04510 [Solirubrobacterales bacterium]
MIGTYVAVVAVCVSSLVIGQAVLGLCGVARWSWIAPAVGLAAVSAICWGTVRLPGDGVIGAVLVALATLASGAFLWQWVRDGGTAVRLGGVVAIGALAATALPFIAENHFGILGTGFNPDMSQHLLAASRLSDGFSSELLRQGYPLGPHAIVVSLEKGLGVSLVHGFTGLTVAVAVLAPLTALAAFPDRSPLRRAAAALVVGLPYLVASYFAQGAFKETMQALWVLAFLLTLRETTRNPLWRDLELRFVPAAVIAIGAVYTYSFPGLIWLAVVLAAWLAIERELPARPLLLALVVLAVGALPELGRMIEFHNFETFDPNGPGLGNLFGQISPLTALGIWFSGDFRVAAGDGAVPAIAYYLGAAFAAVLLVLGLARCVRGRESAILGGAVAVALLYLAARIGGTPYTSAKALEVAAPVATLAIVAPWTAAEPEREFGFGNRVLRAAGSEPAGLPIWAYLAIAGFCSVLAFANAPVGPSTYSPALTGLRPLIAADSTLVLAPRELLDEQHGVRYIDWELRGGRVCIADEDHAPARIPPGIRFVITSDERSRAPYPGMALREEADPYLLWARTGPVTGTSECPLIAVRQARQGSPSG